MQTEPGPPSELDTFLPPSEQGTKGLINNSTKVTVLPAKKKSYVQEVDKSTFSDPFKLRNKENATTNGETLTHLLKSCLGSGIFSMPFAFSKGGVLFSIISTLVVAVICAHCTYVLVQSAHALCYRMRVPSLTFPEVGEAAFNSGSNAFKSFAKPARVCIIIGIFLTYFGTCCAYNVIVAENIQQIVDDRGLLKATEENKRWFILALLIPLILLSYVPNLKTLTIFSQLANVLMACTIGITGYYIFTGEPLKNPTQLPKIASWEDLPEFFSIVIFAMECIGVIMPLENNMKTPRKMLGTCGVMNKGMSIVTVIYFFVGLVGYLKYGGDVKTVITLNLPSEQVSSQCAKAFIAFAVFFTYGLQFYVCLDIVWNGMKDKVIMNAKLCNYLLRTFLVILSVAVAVAVPKIAPFLTIVGALFFSTLGIIFPMIIEMVVFWNDGFGFAYWKLIKRILIIIFGVLAAIFGTHSGIKSIMETYLKLADS